MSSTPHSAKDIIAANIQTLIEQLEQGHSEALTSYLTAMGRFHNYSFGNVLEIARQRPDATRVAGFHTWLQMSRYVRKGEKGIRIFAPMISNKRKNTETSEGDTNSAAPRLMGFRAVYVFDISQTEGEDLPSFSDAVTGNVGEYRDRILCFATAQGIEIEFNSDITPALGMSYGGRIAILPGQSQPEEFSTIVHELAHEILHKHERRAETTKTMRETEAEAVAFVVSKSIGLESGRASADYIHLYNGDAAVLTQSLDAIQRTACVILNAVDIETTEAEAEDIRKAS